MLSPHTAASLIVALMFAISSPLAANDIFLCTGNVDKDQILQNADSRQGQVFTQQNVQIRTNASKQALTTPFKPGALWQWQEHQVDFPPSFFRYENNGEFVWHLSKPGQDDERVITSAMLIFNRLSGDYVLVKNDPPVIFSHGHCDL
ncbi:MAG: hypothetical protein OEZ23_06115 [Gammaproteobacteria bacterium]|nr:hypothetical protein [Gammaproteobacteria bacterium]